MHAKSGLDIGCKLTKTWSFKGNEEMRQKSREKLENLFFKTKDLFDNTAVSTVTFFLLFSLCRSMYHELLLALLGCPGDVFVLRDGEIRVG